MSPSTRGRWLAFLLFATAVLGWGITWVVVRTIVQHVTPVYSSAIRTLIGTAALGILLLARGQFIVPKRGDLPVVIVASLFHTVGYGALISIGLKYVPVGRSVTLGYTVPLWVAPAAWLFLKEVVPPRRLIGIGISAIGLLVMFNPLSFDWSDRNALIGNAVLLLSAVSWSVSIVFMRQHRWIASPFQLLFWQALLGTFILFPLAWLLEPAQHIEWTPSLVASFAYGGLVGSALAFWAMNEVNRRLPAATVSLGILATPVTGIVLSALFLHEPIDPPLIVAAALILTGIGIGATARA